MIRALRALWRFAWPFIVGIAALLAIQTYFIVLVSRGGMSHP